MRTGVVLGAGGYVGQAFHLGALRALAQVTGFDARRADTLVGTSAGSLVAAGLAGGMSADDLAAELLGEQLSPQGAALRARGNGPGSTADP
nr:patatin-like phospholipase family protein [Actinomycetota bacterium]